MIKIFTNKSKNVDRDSFNSTEEARQWIKENTTYFQNGDLVAIVNFEKLSCSFVELRLKMEMFSR